MSKETVTRISVSLDPKLLRRFDEASRDAGFDGRSKAVQGAMRSFIAEEKKQARADTPVIGSLLIVYNHEKRGIDEALTELEHEHMSRIASSVHIHLGVTYCLKVVVVRGRVSEIIALEKSLRSLKGIVQLKVAFLNAEMD